MKKSLEMNFKVPQVGKIITGKIIGKEKSALFLDVENFGIGIIYGKEFVRAKEALKDLKIGDEISAKILEIDNEEGFVELSFIEARQEIAWQKLKKMNQKNETFEVLISKANKGGLIAEIEGIEGFLPVSQLSPENYPRIESGDQNEILKELQKFIGKKLKVKILSLDQEEKTLILSEKAVSLEKKKRILKKYKVGDVVEGEITGVVDFGAFMKFPVSSKKENFEGLIHISELDWKQVKDPSEIVKVGDILKAKIIEISGGKVSLSLKALKENPLPIKNEK